MTNRNIEGQFDIQFVMIYYKQVHLQDAWKVRSPIVMASVFPWRRGVTSWLAVVTKLKIRYAISVLQTFEVCTETLDWAS